MTKHPGPVSERGPTQRPTADRDQSVVSRTSQLPDVNAPLEKDVAERRHAEQGLFEKAQESRSIIDSIPGLVALLSPAGDVEVLNHRMVEYFGKTLEEMKRWEDSDFIHSADRLHVIEVFAHAIESGAPLEYEARLRRFDGVHRWFQVRGCPARDSAGRVARWYFLLTDIDDLKRAEALLAGEKRLLEMVASGNALATVLDALCRLVEETAANCHCGVYLIDQKNHVFQTSAAPTLPASFNDPIVGRPASPETGPCGMAARLMTQVITADVDTDPLWQASPFRPLALTHGLRSCWSTPIFSKAGEVLGTFAIYQRQAATPTQFTLSVELPKDHLDLACDQLEQVQFLVENFQHVLLEAPGQAEVEDENLPQLPNPMHATDALLEQHGIPWQVVIDNGTAELKVAAFASNFGR